MILTARGIEFFRESKAALLQSNQGITLVENKPPLICVVTGSRELVAQSQAANKPPLICVVTGSKLLLLMESEVNKPPFI